MKRLLLYIAVLSVAACNPAQKQQPVAATDPLPSWNEGQNKDAIVKFVTEAVDQTGTRFIPQDERIAVFDNDGTLWCEQPLYFEFIYSIVATREIAAKNADLQKKPELKALARGDMDVFMKSGEKSILEAFAISHTAMKPEQFDAMVETWIDTARHARFGQPYVKLTYKPMVELLVYLRDNGFKTYIVSGGSSIFMRNFTQSAYGIPAEQVIGTMFKAQFVEESREVVLKPEVWHMDDNVGKPEAIFQIIGRKPVLAFGNSDGDLQMLQWTSTNPLPNMALILHHTDAEREYAYDRTSSIGKLDKALDEGKAQGWVIVDMKQDFKTVFSFQ